MKYILAILLSIFAINCASATVDVTTICVKNNTKASSAIAYESGVVQIQEVLTYDFSSELGEIKGKLPNASLSVFPRDMVITPAVGKDLVQLSIQAKAEDGTVFLNGNSADVEDDAERTRITFDPLEISSDYVESGPFTVNFDISSRIALPTDDIQVEVCFSAVMEGDLF